MKLSHRSKLKLTEPLNNERSLQKKLEKTNYK